MTPLLEARGLEVGYPTAGGLLGRGDRFLTVVRDASFTVMPGKTLGIVGESGCGKTTLGRALLRLAPVTGGQVLWQGQDMAGWSAATLRAQRRDMQLIFQDPVAALDPRMTLGRIVSRPLATFEPGLTRSELIGRAEETLRLVGLSADFVNRYPHELSGGQAQRVGIARALILGPKLIVCDEPVSALDVSIQAQVVNLLMDLQDRLGIALIFISHNLAIVRHISHEVMVMCLGRVVERAPRDAFYGGPLHPYARALMDAVPEPEPEQERRRAGRALAGEVPSVLTPPKGCVFQSRCPVAVERCGHERPDLRRFDDREAACHLIEAA
jgi:oligopeptide transport system ATP-binding protein